MKEDCEAKSEVRLHKICFGSIRGLNSIVQVEKYGGHMKKYVLLSLLTILVHIPSSHGQVPSNKMGWHNQPKSWSDSDGKISVAVESKTDFWRITHYGYTTDNGHFYYQEREGDFTATVKVQGDLFMTKQG